jgi:hypothetical protein
MPDDVTKRHSLPNLYVGQSQKELTHNEALARIDALLHPVTEAQLTTPPVLAHRQRGDRGVGRAVWADCALVGGQLALSSSRCWNDIVASFAGQETILHRPRMG